MSNKLISIPPFTPSLCLYLQYFNHRLANHSNATGEESQNALQANFNSALAVCSMVPLVICTCLTSILHQRFSQKIRILASLVAILVVFCVTAIFVKMVINPVAFFALTMIKIIIINAFGAILQGSLNGMAGVLPDGYTTPILIGQGLAGIVAALAMILAIASSSDLMDCTLGYFITACIVIGFTIVSYIILQNLKFYRYYLEKNQKDQALQRQLIRNGDSSRGMSTTPKFWTIFKKIRVIALSVCCTFAITLSIFPAVAADVKSTVANGGFSGQYFIPAWCFLSFNMFDLVGRSLTYGCKWPWKDSKLLLLLVLVRLIFVPLFMLCNVQPRSSFVVFSSDIWFIVFIILFAFSSGYLTSLCMCLYPKLVDAHETETAGTIMTFFMALGLALGASFSFLFRRVI
ncbi:hypothetical protein QTP70_024312 [Hemibagrus guttatus]|uniref:Equilibrative nucleoside transporter 1 n=1 Tax=Hemibagrus guttatus TaxID=175788 RepID=A0AAE0QVJ3_9TELE|nr:hypothetical protein QTP70_024312 [Hemibagrus guttatus]KAK3562234.1 hypothetical protein QTP86_031155 [Hemibagrus guttatus]